MVSVQWLRALAVMMVIVFHVLLKAQILGLTTLSFSQGAAGVDLFFIISGFIMIYITEKRKYSFTDFMKRRVIRIIPLYWLLSMVVCIVYFYNPSVVNSHNGETDILSSFSLLPIQGKVMLLEVGWTLRYEFFFYFIFAISIFLFRKNTVYCLIIIVATSMVSLFNLNNFYVQYFTNPIILEFSFGIASYYLFRKITKKIGSALLITGVMLLALFGLTEYGLQNRVVFYGLPMLFVFLGMLSFEDSIKKSEELTSRFFSYLGDASYSLYISHTLAIGAVAKVLSLFNNGIAPYMFVPLAIILSLLTGIVCYECVEKPITKFVKNLNLNAATTY